MKDLFDKILINNSPLGKWANVAEGYFIFPKLEGNISNRMVFNGKEYVVWSVNDYLGLANHDEVRKTDAQAAADYGAAYPMGARMMSGETLLHQKLEKQLASFVKKENAYLLNFGFQGVLSIIDTLTTRNDVIVYDAESHACIVDGIRLHIGKRYAYKHNDIESLEKNLIRATKTAKKNNGGILVITEGVFGMNGDQGRLKEIIALKKKYKFRLFVDDAHGFGVFGETGAGVGEEQGVQDGIDVYFATFAKAMASTGAFVAGDKKIIQYLKYNMRSQMFAKSLQMQLVVGIMKRLALLKTQPEIRKKLWQNTNLIQKGLKEKGFNLGNTKSCITPVYLKGSIYETSSIVKELRDNFKVFCSVVIYPIIPKGLILLRLIPTANHTNEDIEITLNAFSEINRNLQQGKYKDIKEVVDIKN